MHNLKKQQGLTFITILIILGLIAFFTWLVLKIAPIYINHGRVRQAIEAVKQTPDVELMTPKGILNSFDKRFDINYVEHVTHDDIVITKHGNYVKVEVDYEVVQPMCCHLSVLAQFHEEFEKGKE